MTIATEETVQAVAPALIKHYWLITLQYASFSGLTASTVDGTATLPAGTSRAAAFPQVQAKARQMIGIPDGSEAAVLFYSLERDEL